MFHTTSVHSPKAGKTLIVSAPKYRRRIQKYIMFIYHLLPFDFYTDRVIKSLRFRRISFYIFPFPLFLCKIFFSAWFLILFMYVRTREQNRWITIKQSLYLFSQIRNHVYIYIYIYEYSYEVEVALRPHSNKSPICCAVLIYTEEIRLQFSFIIVTSLIVLQKAFQVIW